MRHTRPSPVGVPRVRELGAWLLADRLVNGASCGDVKGGKRSFSACCSWRTVSRGANGEQCLDPMAHCRKSRSTGEANFPDLMRPVFPAPCFASACVPCRLPKSGVLRGGSGRRLAIGPLQLRVSRYSGTMAPQELPMLRHLNRAGTTPHFGVDLLRRRCCSQGSRGLPSCQGGSRISPQCNGSLPASVDSCFGQMPHAKTFPTLCFFWSTVFSFIQSPTLY